MGLEENKKVALDLLNAIDVGDEATFRRLVDDEVKWWIIGGNDSIVDKETVIRLTKIIYAGAASPFNFKYLFVTAEDDRVLVEATGSMKMKTGALYENVYVFKFQIRNGKVIAVREYMDTKILDTHLVPLFANA